MHEGQNHDRSNISEVHLLVTQYGVKKKLRNWIAILSLQLT